ncbi:PDZ domain-containing protein [Paenibacillus sp. LHD-117]|uniref:PDZ domain-containing protein n=1 Tax=Paenibacillus sp. LHD-117 TaxID=3071412 RepID=UPI0027E1140B|nr:PDZ domain-containing protein [Paenibacillus sp. LHD-117]MDQ6422479.1 PDZ domain-containing protein [Paenibacillus sp. LHD-117]
METAREIVELLGSAALQMVTGPFYYIAVLFIILQYTRQMRLERQLFAVKLHDWKGLALKALATGLLVGVGISAASVFIGASLSPSAVLWLWAIAAVLMLARIRYLCFAYSAGIVTLLQWAVGFTPLHERADWIGAMATSLARIDAAGLLLLVALLHLAEALLVRLQGDKLSTPLFLEGKRGKLVGGYMLQGFWPVPLLLLAPVSAETATASASSAALPWTSLLGGMLPEGWTFIALPMIIGFTEMTRSMLPAAKARHAAKGLLLYSVCLGGAALAAWWQPALLPVAALASILLHEALVWRSKAMEARREPLYVHDTRGLRILGIVPGTPAETMGLSVGEMLYKVNGVRVSTKEELYSALASNSAFCKLEALTVGGEPKFAQRARYAGEHHQLGVILAPDEQANFYAASGPASLLELLRGRKASNRRGGKATAGGSEERLQA